MRLHKVAELFPRMLDDEFDALVEDIKTRGVLQPILVRNGVILDGRHRWEACKKLGIECPTEEWDKNGSTVDLVISLNLKRRHLTASQKGCVAADALPMYEAEAKERKRAAGEIHGRGQKVPERIPEPIGGDARDHAAKAVGVNPRYVSDAKTIKERAPDKYEEIRQGKTTISKVKSELKRDDKIASIKKTAKLDTVTGRFSVIYADPPWRYEYAETKSRAIENQYPTMTLDEICALKVDDLCNEDAVLFLWTTSPKLVEGIDVVHEWGFEYRTCMIWLKDKIGMGYYARQKHEILLIGTRGKLPTPKPENRPPSVIEAPREEHSAKPEAFYAAIESMYPELRGQWLELFQRQPREDWQGWGFEA